MGHAFKKRIRSKEKCLVFKKGTKNFNLFRFGSVAQGKLAKIVKNLRLWVSCFFLCESYPFCKHTPNTFQPSDRSNGDSLSALVAKVLYFLMISMANPGPKINVFNVLVFITQSHQQF